MTVEISEIGVEGLGIVRDLAYRIWPEAYAGILPAEQIGPMLDDIYALETLQDDVVRRGHRYFLARSAGAPAGFASAYREGDRVWIKKLYVLGSARGLGLGSRLMDRAIAAFPGAQSAALYVNDGNAPAIAWYKARGFAEEAKVPVRMGPYDFIDYVMARPL
ncbi:MAG TPA: GNAT family N-acetyltransferase [Devosia sp.]|nr:GNAT family N-acetyltransferase [Devosia sp.]